MSLQISNYGRTAALPANKTHQQQPAFSGVTITNLSKIKQELGSDFANSLKTVVKKKIKEFAGKTDVVISYQNNPEIIGQCLKFEAMAKKAKTGLLSFLMPQKTVTNSMILQRTDNKQLVREYDYPTFFHTDADCLPDIINSVKTLVKET